MIMKNDKGILITDKEDIVREFIKVFKKTHHRNAPQVWFVVEKKYYQ